MSIFRKIRGAIEKRTREVGLINELCEHLRQIGVEATVLDFKSPEAIHHSRTMHIYYTMENLPPLGGVKVEGRNIDLVEVSRIGAGGGSAGSGGHLVYRYNYVVKANVGNLENQLKAEAKQIKKGFSGEIVDYKWEGGELAQLLNADSELKNMLVELGSPSLMVTPYKKDQYVGIMPVISPITTIVIGGIPVKYDGIVGRKAFPTREAFEAYDRIAQHIRSLLSSQP